MNKVVLIGRLTKDPELRFTPNGKGVANFTLAVNRPFANQDGKKEADFIPIQVWGKPAENCATYLGKGSQVAIDGRLQVRTYETDEGQKRWVTEVVANSVEFLDNRKNKDKIVDNSNEFGHEVDFNEDDIPF
ncbi:single-strand binding protein [Desulfonispora thiosulfatigenes DSM 11270]|uniref:Single-stranded DNA-binding protein n=1 Tax=Desulfonispora thiosulfatigenes DSM 11270 TaxID=656914 RepID=A0A1W1VQW5_DESTI|nr:single-stranded DNA-binding protein [Desulfonispora thiosulfatigenes]SMB95481.1 single-strand binding protein [Desulfonispora thiosulfatigenes DSM 11270]